MIQLFIISSLASMNVMKTSKILPLSEEKNFLKRWLNFNSTEKHTSLIPGSLKGYGDEKETFNFARVFEWSLTYYACAIFTPGLFVIVSQGTLTWTNSVCLTRYKVVCKVYVLSIYDRISFLGETLGHRASS